MHWPRCALPCRKWASHNDETRAGSVDERRTETFAFSIEPRRRPPRFARGGWPWDTALGARSSARSWRRSPIEFGDCCSEAGSYLTIGKPSTTRCRSGSRAVVVRVVVAGAVPADRRAAGSQDVLFPQHAPQLSGWQQGHCAAAGDWGWPRMSGRLGLHRLIQMPGGHELLFTNPNDLADKIIEAGRD
jgi:hypothetical protein